VVVELEPAAEPPYGVDWAETTTVSVGLEPPVKAVTLARSRRNGTPTEYTVLVTTEVEVARTVQLVPSMEPSRFTEMVAGALGKENCADALENVSWQSKNLETATARTEEVST
jgi:hypothetical protein